MIATVMDSNVLLTSISYLKLRADEGIDMILRHCSDSQMRHILTALDSVVMRLRYMFKAFPLLCPVCPTVSQMFFPSFPLSPCHCLIQVIISDTDNWAQNVSTHGHALRTFRHWFCSLK